MINERCASLGASGQSDKSDISTHAKSSESPTFEKRAGNEEIEETEKEYECCTSCEIR